MWNGKKKEDCFNSFMVKKERLAQETMTFYQNGMF